ncbi:hypothetical protein [Chengkuizengella sediminis]|nr:hypothetical protein [Chengkuizengella sediminis]NDI34417.1 hypothetical protein [Chengkuizengella sediminis]
MKIKRIFFLHIRYMNIFSFEVVYGSGDGRFFDFVDPNGNQLGAVTF